MSYDFQLAELLTAQKETNRLLLEILEELKLNDQPHESGEYDYVR